ncbi:MAG: 7-cyano-7-deazaguanine synthase [Candidatus Saliniplasma sp.]
MVYKIVVLLSGGIDSPVAAHMFAEAGADVVLLNIDHRPFTDDKTIENVDNLVDRLKEIHPDIKFYRTKFETIHNAITKNTDSSFRCILCRRMMYRTAEKLAKKVNASSIATGESLGQVASQTLSNLATEDSAVDVPIHRPLIGLDKNEIIDIAKGIGTFDISIKPAICCLLTPEGPRVKSSIENVLHEEDEIEMERLIDGLNFYEV